LSSVFVVDISDVGGEDVESEGFDFFGFVDLSVGSLESFELSQDGLVGVLGFLVENHGSDGNQGDSSQD